MLTQGGNYKTPIDRSPSAPKLMAISEAPDQEDVIEEIEEIEEDPEEEHEEEEDIKVRRRSRDDSDIHTNHPFDGDLVTYNQSSLFDLEIGNDVEELKRDEKVRFQLEQHHSDEDDNSVSSDSESGFSEQDVRESSSSGSTQANTPDLRSTNDHDVSFTPTPYTEGDDISDTASEQSREDDAQLNDITSHLNGLDLKTSNGKHTLKSGASDTSDVHVRL